MGQGFHQGGEETPQEELEEAQGDQEGHQGQGQEVGEGPEEGQEAEAVEEQGGEEGLGGEACGQPSQEVAPWPRGKPEGREDEARPRTAR